MDYIAYALAFVQANPAFCVSAAIVLVAVIEADLYKRRVRRAASAQAGIMPDYIAWLEAKVEDYETVLTTYADPCHHDGGELAARVLHHYQPGQHQVLQGETLQ